MKRVALSVVLAGLLAAGCADQKGGSGMSGPAAGTPKGSGTASTAGGAASAEVPAGKGSGEEAGDGEGAGEQEVVVSTATGGSLALSPENTRIVFIGTHSGEKPDPRIGGFEKFTGKAVYDPASKTLKSVSVDIETESLWTKLPPLTGHLKNADFFDVKELPKASFQSTSIEATDAAAGEYTINGDLTLHGVTKPISFPAKVTIEDSTLTLKSDFKIDRTEFEMNFGTDKIEKEVAISIVVGQKTDPADTHLP